MKKIKKILAMVLAMAMVLGMSITSFAAIDGAKLTVKGLSTEDGAKAEVKIYLLYELDENNNLWKRAEWATMLPAGDEITDKEELEELKDADILKQLKEKIANDNIVASATQEDITAGTWTFGNLQAGAYFVTVTDSTGHIEYGPMVGVTYEYDEETGLMVASTDAEVVAKPSKTTTQKEQNGSTEDAVVEYGDLITYTIKATVPPVGNTFVVNDTLTNGTYQFTGEAVKGVTPKFEITVGGETPDPAINAPTPTVEGNTSSFTLDLGSLTAEGTSYAGQQVVITYTAIVNSVDPITNTANTDHGSGVTSVPGTTDAWTGKITITKEEAETAVKLNGAQFVIYRETEEGTKEYATIEDGHVTGVWTVYTDEGLEELESYEGMTITTAGEGTATIAGLKEGTYYFKEVVAPNGYSINETPAKAELTATKGEDDKITEVTATTTMTDTKLGSLPSTGGIGTTIFTIGGCAIMILAAALYFMTRRKSAK